MYKESDLDIPALPMELGQPFDISGLHDKYMKLLLTARSILPFLHSNIVLMEHMTDWLDYISQHPLCLGIMTKFWPIEYEQK
jgi:hypothetical protein